MSDPVALRAGRTFALCIIGELGLLGLGWYAIRIAAAPPLVLAVGFVVAMPIAAWIGGKAWASAMAAIAAVFGKE